jgi:hypothetical protein
MVHVVARHKLEMVPSADEQVIEALLANGPQPAAARSGARAGPSAPSAEGTAAS